MCTRLSSCPDRGSPHLDIGQPAWVLLPPAFIIAEPRGLCVHGVHGCTSSLRRRNAGLIAKFALWPATKVMVLNQPAQHTAMFASILIKCSRFFRSTQAGPAQAGPGGCCRLQHRAAAAETETRAAAGGKQGGSKRTAAGGKASPGALSHCQ